MSHVHETLPRFDTQPFGNPAEVFHDLPPQPEMAEQPAGLGVEIQPDAHTATATVSNTEADAKSHELHGGHPEGCQCEVHQNAADDFAKTLFGNTEKGHDRKEGHTCDSHCGHSQKDTDNFADSLFSRASESKPTTETVSGHGEACACASCKATQAETDKLAEGLFGNLHPAKEHSYDKHDREQTSNHHHDHAHKPVVEQTVNLDLHHIDHRRTPEPNPDRLQTEQVQIAHDVRHSKTPTATASSRHEEYISRESTSDAATGEHSSTDDRLPAYETSGLADFVELEGALEVTESVELFSDDTDAISTESFLAELPISDAEIGTPNVTANTANAKIQPKFETEPAISIRAKEIISHDVPELSRAEPLLDVAANILISNGPIEMAKINTTVESIATMVEAHLNNQPINEAALTEALTQLGELLDIEYPQVLQLLEVQSEQGVIGIETLEILRALQKLTHDEYRKEFLSRFSAATQDNAADNQTHIIQSLGGAILHLFTHSLGQRFATPLQVLG